MNHWVLKGCAGIYTLYCTYIYTVYNPRQVKTFHLELSLLGIYGLI